MGENSEYQGIGLHLIAKNPVLKTIDTFFPLTSGLITNYYLQSVGLECDGNSYSTAISCLSRLVSANAGDFDVISGGESRDWDFSNPVAVMLEKPHAKIYKDGKMLGAEVDGKQVVHVLDILNYRSSPRNLWVPMIRQAGGKISKIFSFVDTLEGENALDEMGVECHSVVRLDGDAWRYLGGRIPDKDYDAILERKFNRDAWARNMLLSEKGMARLRDLLTYTDPEVRKKALKIVTNGYPGLKDEIIERLKGFGVNLIS